MTKIERIARAMVKARGWDDADEIFTLPSRCEGLRKLYLKLAKAAVDELEKPNV